MCAQNAINVIAITFKLKHSIYHMFQNFWAGNVSVFCDVTDENHRSGGLFSEFNEFCGGFSYLRDAPSSTLNIVAMQRLYRVDNHNVWIHRFNLLKNVLRLGFGKNQTIFSSRVNSFCTHFDLLCTFFPRNIKRGVR